MDPSSFKSVRVGDLSTFALNVLNKALLYTFGNEMALIEFEIITPVISDQYKVPLEKLSVNSELENTVYFIALVRTGDEELMLMKRVIVEVVAHEIDNLWYWAKVQIWYRPHDEDVRYQTVEYEIQNAVVEKVLEEDSQPPSFLTTYKVA